MVLDATDDLRVVGEAGDGAGGLLKDALATDLVSALRVVASGASLAAPSVTRRLVEHFVRATRAPEDASARLAGLTVREREVLTLITRGRSNTEIAAELRLSESTVKTHVGRVLAKLDVRDRVHAVIAGHECGPATVPLPGRTAPVPDLAASVTNDSAPVPGETR